MADESTNGLRPYKGLIPYTEEDALFFFGRDQEQENIISYLMESRLTLLYGPTGAGKSSVLRAGVAYRLHQLAIENSEQFGNPELAVVVFNKWRGDPLLSLQESIQRAVKRVLNALPVKLAARPKFWGVHRAISQAQELILTLWAKLFLNIESPLRESPSNDLSAAIEAYSKLVHGDLLIILDQFEEYFLYHSLSRGETDFSKEFVRAVNDTKLRVSFLISIREDALAKLDYFKGRIPDLFKNYLRIQHLTADDAQEAIRKPLEVYSEITNEKFTIDDRLVDEVCEQVKAGSVFIGDTGYGAVEENLDVNHVEASFLQLVMTKLWDYAFDRRYRHLRLFMLKRLGGAEQIVKSHLNVNLTGFPDEEQDAAAAIFHYLVTPSGTKVAYTASDLAKSTNLPEVRVESVLEKLCAVDTRILRTFYTDRNKMDEKNYEIYHDVLASAILDWRVWYLRDKERAKIEREAKEKKEQEAALQRVKEEKERERIKQEQRRERRKQRQLFGIVIVSTLFTISMVILLLYAERQRQRALTSTKDAVRQSEIAEAQRAETQKALEIVDALDRSVPYFKAIMRGHSAPVFSVDFSPDQEMIVTASSDGSARIWVVGSGKLLFELKGHLKSVNHAMFSPDGKLIATASSDGTARIWDANSGRSLHILGGHTDEVSAARFSPDSKFIVTASSDGTAGIWDANTGKSITFLSRHSGPVTYASFSPDSSLVVTASTDGTARVWTLQTGRFVALVGHEDVVNMAVFRSDGNYVVTASADGDARIWQSDGRNIAVLKGHTETVNSAEFSPDGAWVVTASNDKTARVWKVTTRQSIELSGHLEEVRSAKFSADNSRIVTTSADNMARIWEAKSGKMLFELRGHTDTVNAAVFSPARKVGATAGQDNWGKIVATASQDNTARTWDVGGEGGILIKGVVVKAKPDDYSGPCPVRVRISGLISAIGSGTIRYRFSGRDMSPGPERTLKFETSGTKEVSMTLVLRGKKHKNLSGSYYLEIISPQPQISSDATYNIKCQIASGAEEKPKQPSSQPSPEPSPSASP